MLFINEAGEGVEVATGVEALGLGSLTEFDDEQMRSLLDQLLTGCGMNRSRVAKILRTDITTVDTSLGVALPLDPMTAMAEAMEADTPDRSPVAKGRVNRSRRP